jgi:uncharacterized protein (TIGR02599 family)
MKNLRPSKAFTIIELLVSMSIVMVLLVVLFQMVNQTSQIWKYTTGKAEQFRSARAAFESITRQLSQATLNTYWDYDRVGDTLSYTRQSELRFICGPATDLIEKGFPSSDTGAEAVGQAIFFQAPIGYVDSFKSTALSSYEGLDNLLNTWGYFIKKGSDVNSRPPFISASVVPEKVRYRLMEFMQSSDKMSIYYYTSPPKSLANAAWQLMSDLQRVNAQAKYRNYSGKEWFSEAIHNEEDDQPVTHVLADNIIALVFEPRLSEKDMKTVPGGLKLAPKYKYDSTKTEDEPSINPKNQLPPIVKVTMVAIDEESAARLAASSDPDLKIDDLFTDADAYDSNLEALKKTLDSKHLKYRVFSTDVSIRGAKWSRN